MRPLAILVLLFVPLAFPAVASDGVREINATCAVEIFTDDVEVDVAVFGIHVPGSCTGSPLTSTPKVGSGPGIQIAGTLRGLAVR